MRFLPPIQKPSVFAMAICVSLEFLKRTKPNLLPVLLLLLTGKCTFTTNPKLEKNFRNHGSPVLFGRLSTYSVKELAITSGCTGLLLLADADDFE
ncbi:hypothetical protein Vadar_000226 [Vaccinium darrowii]|uniref:Uncharacterized protein n=1 Tax=Vaccinium darrowii TaxID=229202 RepID=A0ACB7ZH54_9ERIC|nr:hypothetical protein Vadar_000226 [Vaccinium darrowii]